MTVTGKMTKHSQVCGDKIKLTFVGEFPFDDFGLPFAILAHGRGYVE